MHGTGNEIAARNALFVNYATPNKAAEQHLPRSYFDNPVIYPDAQVMARSEFYTRLAPRMQRTLNATRYWTIRITRSRYEPAASAV